MSLTATVAAGVETAFSAAGDLVVLGTYRAVGSTGGWNPVNESAAGGSVEYSGVRMIRTSLTDSEREASPVGVSDVKILIPARDLPGTRPGESDTLVLAGTGYNVTGIKSVPGDSLWILFARAR